eukprot:7652679-Prorocentrum_lima.AAC.1
MDDFSSISPDGADMLVVPCREFHAGRTLCACAVPTEQQEDLYATIGDDGRILIRDGSEEKLRAHLPSFLVHTSEEGDFGEDEADQEGGQA